MMDSYSNVLTTFTIPQNDLQGFRLSTAHIPLAGRICVKEPCKSCFELDCTKISPLSVWRQKLVKWGCCGVWLAILMLKFPKCSVPVGVLQRWRRQGGGGDDGGRPRRRRRCRRARWRRPRPRCRPWPSLRRRRRWPGTAGAAAAEAARRLPQCCADPDYGSHSCIKIMQLRN